MLKRVLGVVAVLLIVLPVCGFAQTPGSEAWSVYCGGRPSGVSVADDGTIYAGNRTDAGLTAYDPDGTKRWSLSMGPADAPSIAPDGTLYAANYDGEWLRAVNPDGTVQWSYQVPGIVTSPAVGADGTLYVAAGDLYSEHLLALAPDGSQKWTSPLAGPGRGMPAIGVDGTIFVAVETWWSPNPGGVLYAIDPNGEHLWEYAIDERMQSPPAVRDDGSVCVGTNAGVLHCLDSAGQLLWTFSAGGHSGTPVIDSDGTIYVQSSRYSGPRGGTLFALNPDGSEKWDRSYDYEFYGSPAIGADGTIYFTSADQRLHALTSEGVERWSTIVTSWRATSPVLGPNGMLYLGAEIWYWYSPRLKAFHTDSAGPAASAWPMARQNSRRTSRRRPIDMPPVLLELGRPHSSTLPAGEVHHFTVDTENGRSLLIELETDGGLEAVALDSGYGGRPAPGAGHWSTMAPTALDRHELLVAPTEEGALAISVLATWVTGDGGGYTLTARYADTHLSDVAPRSGGNVGSVTALLSGLGFVEGVTAELGGVGMPTIGVTELTVISSTELSARFDLVGATPGLYDVNVRWPGGAEHMLTGAFTVTPGIGPQLETSLEVPEAVRPGRRYVYWLEYGNEGDTDMPAPLLVIESPQNVAMRLTADEPYSGGGLQVLGISHGPTAGVLSPGEHHRIPIYFISPFSSNVTFEVEYVTADASAIDWDAVETEVRSDEMGDELWSAAWSNFTAVVGGTWADYVGTLGEMATYLGRHGRHIYDVDALYGALFARAAGSYLGETLDAAVDAYTPARGLPLTFMRAASGGLAPRFTLGPLGRGWAHGYELRLEQTAADRVTIHLPGGSTRSFFLENGAWRGGAGEHAILEDGGGGAFTLRETSGVALHFGPGGKLSVIDDPGGNALTLAYAGARLETVTHSNGQILTVEYNPDGRIQYLTDHAGRVTEYIYGPTGELLESVIAPGGVTTGYSYRSDSGDARSFALETVTHPDGTHTYFAYDSEGRLNTTHLDGGEETVTLAYDHLGTVTATDEFGNQRTLRMGGRGETLERLNPLGELHRFVYDEHLDLRRVEQPDGTAYELDYDTRGNPIAITSPGHLTVHMASTTIPVRIDWFEDALEQVMDFEYENGWPVGITYPDASTEAFSYDPVDGDLETFTNRRAEVTVFDHNGLGELTDIDVSGGSWIDLAHDENERSWAFTDDVGTTTIDLDDRGLLDTVIDAAGRTVTATVNDAGRRERLETDDGFILVYGYDAAGRLETLTDGDGFEIVRYSYDAAGRLEREDRGNGTHSIYVYDAADRLLSITHHAPGGAVQSSFTYTYDTVGNPVTLTTTDGVTEFDYDPDGQLVTITRPDDSEVVFTYDDAGNRELASDDGSETVYEANELNQYTGVGSAILTYDGDGNLVTVTDGGGTDTLTWNAASRLQTIDGPAIGSWSFRDDAFGQRVEAVHNGVGRHYQHDPRGLGDVIAEYDDEGGLVARFIHGLGLVTRLDAAGNYAWYGFDGTGNTRQLADASGAVVNTYDYSPFGISTAGAEIVPNPFRYGGRHGVMDDGHGLLYMRARYYDPATGHFVSPDPIRLAGGSNMYTYVANSPVRLIDPSGLGFSRPPPSLFKSGQDAVEARNEYGESIHGVRGSGTPQQIQDSLTRNHTARRNFIHEGSAFAWHSSIEFYKNVATFGAGSAGKAAGTLVGGVAHSAIRVRELEHDGVIGDHQANPPRENLPSQSSSSGTTRVIFPADPNEKAGPPGLGPNRVVRTGQVLPYTVYFENVPTATAAAQEIFVTDCLDRNLDWTTLEVDEVVFGDHTVTNAGRGAVFSERVTVADLREDNDSTWWVDVASTVDFSTGCMDVSLEMLDPETGELPMDVFAGFLPPEDGEGAGQGHISYSVKVKEGLDDGRLVRNRAAIVFDTNDAIWTNEVINAVGPQLYTLTVTVAGGGAGTATSDPAGVDCGTECIGWFAEWTAVALTATPAEKSLFAGWSGDADCTDGQVTLEADTECIATFAIDSAIFGDDFETGGLEAWSLQVPEG